VLCSATTKEWREEEGEGARRDQGHDLETSLHERSNAPASASSPSLSEKPLSQDEHVPHSNTAEPLTREGESTGNASSLHTDEASFSNDVSEASEGEEYDVQPSHQQSVYAASTRTSGTELELIQAVPPATQVGHLARASQGEEAGTGSTTPHTRLVIRDIDVENFKSYFGQHRIGPFHKTFTAVIGPNGSGKSNVIDSMLFVFGRNAKKLRLDKLAEVIHNSAAHPSLSYASVTVNFVRLLETAADEKDAEQRQEVPNSELRIKREVYRSGVSQYYIDGTRSTQKEVMECLIAHGVDLEHNRFLILQGEVEQIALMKPKAEKEGEEGLLEYLDDLIGTSEYVPRISAMTSTAEAAQLARLEALDKERKLKAEREALDDAKNSTLSFVTKDNQLQKTLIVMCQLRMRGIEEKLEEPRRRLAEVDERIAEMEAAVAQKRAEKAAAEESFVAAKKKVAEVQKTRDGVRARKQTAEGQLEQVKSGADQEEKARKKVADQLRKAKEELQRALLHQQDAEREAAIHQQNQDEATTACASLQSEYDAMSEKLLPQLRPLRQSLEEKKQQFAPYERAVTEAKEQLHTSQSRLAGLSDAVTKKQQQLAEVEASMQRSEARVSELERLLRDADRKDLRDEVLRVQDQIGESARRKYAINASIQELKNTYRDGEADDRAMEFLLAQRSLKGYYGTLRQLGRIDDVYDIAAGVASNAWGFHVVEDRATATAALELLKQNNIGRATVMVVSEVEREMAARMATLFTPPNAKARRLFDLIQPTNPKFRSVFYQAVRDTLVVETLTEARETAFGNVGSSGSNSNNNRPTNAPGQRYRVVTVKGELVEPTGAITGGGAVPRGAKLKAARSPQDKQAIKDDLQRLQQDLISAAEEERALNVRLHQLHEQESQVSPEQLRKMRHELNALIAKQDSDAARVTTLRSELEQATQEWASKRAACEANIAACETALEKAEKSRIAHHADVAALEQQVDEAGGAKFKEISAALTRQQERVEAEEGSLRACRRLAQKHRATQERKRSDIADYEKQLRVLEEEVQDNLKEKVKACVEVLEVLVKELNGAEAQLANAQAAAEEARAAIPIINGAALNAQKQLDDEQRYRQTEAAKIADALQELSKFQQKIEGCEEKIRENAELYGIETLQLGNNDVNSSEEDDESESSDGGTDKESRGEEISSAQDRGSDAGRRKRARTSRHRHRHNNSKDNDENEEDGSGEERSRRHRRPSQRPRREGLRQMTFRLSPEELAGCDYDRSVHLAKALSEETRRLHGEIDFRAVALWRERDVAHREAKAHYEAKKSVSDEAERELQTLRETRRTAFMTVFENIRMRLKEVYQLLTHGGDADMELVDVNDPFEGVNFVVRPPKKSWKQISNLSGGEKTLSSLALIFSLHYIKPTPIYVMDEIDAALDFRNVSIVAHYVLRQARGAQFIIISLRNNMFEEAHQLVGVCKVNDTTSTLVLMPRSFRRLIGAQLLEAAAVRQRRRSRQVDDAAADNANRENTTSLCADEQGRLLHDDGDVSKCPAGEKASTRTSGVYQPRTPSSGARPTVDGATPLSTTASCGRPSSGSDGTRGSHKSVHFHAQYDNAGTDDTR
jgi:structural maintenance of chromosome 4